MKKWPTVLGLSLSILTVSTRTQGVASAGDGSTAIRQGMADDPLIAQAREVLHQIVAGELSWEKMHAAEALVACGEAERVRALFERERLATESPPFRTSQWRFLAVTSPSKKERDRWIAKLEQAFLDPTGPDRVTALEILCKLQHRFQGQALETVRETAREPAAALTPFSLWALQLAGEPGSLERLTALLSSDYLEERLYAADALSYLRPTDSAARRALARAADAEPPDHTDVYAMLHCAALALDADPARAALWQGRLERLLEAGLADEETAKALLPRCTSADEARLGLAKLIQDPHPNTQIAAAWMILKLKTKDG